MSYNPRGTPLLGLKSVVVTARHRLRVFGKQENESFSIKTCVYLPLLVLFSLALVCGMTVFAKSGRSVKTMSLEVAKMSMYEIPTYTAYEEEQTSLTEDDFISAARVSPWSYLLSRDTQEKQGTITLNTILRPSRLDEYGTSHNAQVNDTDVYVFDENTSALKNDMVKMLKTDTSTSESTKPKAAIIYLLNPKKCCVTDSVELLFENFNRQFRYPVIIMHETNITPKEVLDMLAPVLRDDELKLITPTLIEFSMPPNMTLQRFKQFRENAEAPLNKLKRFKIGYSHMIRFFFKEIFERHDIKELEYFWRLDTDSYVTSPINYDVFQHMQDNKYTYGYMGSSFDPLKVTVGFPELVQNYMDSHKALSEKVTANLRLWKNGTHLKGTHLTGVWPFRTSQPIIYNNFEIVHIPTFSTNQMKHFVKKVDDTNNIYWLRWGDAALRFFQLMAFLDVKKDIYCFVNDFGYKHQTYKSLPAALQNDPFYANFTIPSKRVN